MNEGVNGGCRDASTWPCLLPEDSLLSNFMGYLSLVLCSHWSGPHFGTSQSPRGQSQHSKGRPSGGVGHKAHGIRGNADVTESFNNACTSSLITGKNHGQVPRCILGTGAGGT